MKIVVLDDHPVILRSVAEMISKKYPEAQITAFSNLIDARNAIINDEINLIIIDLKIGESKSFNIIDLCSAKSIKCVVYSSYYSKSFVEEAVSKGISGYVSKGSDPICLEEAIRFALNGIIYYCPMVKESLIKPAMPNDNNARPILTPKQEEILKLIISGMDNKEISDFLNLSYHTIRAARRDLLTANGCSLAVLIKRYINWNS